MPTEKKQEQKRRDLIVKYRSLDEHPDGITPPPPCNRWCSKITLDKSGNEVDSEILPWLDECHQKKICVGIDTRGDGDPVPVFRNHLGFEESDYIIMEENAFKYDDDGNIVTEESDSGGSVPVADFRYVVGVDATCFIAEHTFRIAGASMQSNRKILEGLTVINNNLIQLLSMVNKAINPQSGGKDSIDAIQDQTSLPDDRIGP